MVKQSNFYDLIDHLVNTNFNAKKMATGKYILVDLGIELDVRMRSFYLVIDTSRYCQFTQFKKKEYLRNDIIKCGLQITASSGKTYSYPDLRDYFKDTPDDNFLRAGYYFTCIDQIIKFFNFPDLDFGFKKVNVASENDN